MSERGASDGIEARTGAPAPAPAGAGRDVKIRGLILAAGRGTRLGGAAQEVPKCLLEIGRRHLVEHQLDALADAGVGPTTMVVGYAAEEVRELVGLRAEYLVSRRWSTTNSLYSFWLARERLAGPTMILNSDVLFSPEVLERLLKVDGDAIAFDSSSGHAREQMKVAVEDGRVVDMRKDLPLDRVGGENVGILKLTAESVRELVALAETVLEEEGEKAWVGAAMRRLVRARPVAAVDVAGLPWVEIDFPTDLVRARKEVWPAIRDRRPHRRRMLMWGLGLAPLVAGSFGWGLATGLRRSGVSAEWETLTLAGGERTTLRKDAFEEAWWHLDGDGVLTARVERPGTLRIDSRLLGLERDVGRYVLEVALDGVALDWSFFETRPSKSAEHPGGVVGKRRRVELELGPGGHAIAVRLVAPPDTRCLVRIRALGEGSDE